MGFAEELWMRFLPKYLESLGAAVWAIGLFDAIKTWIGAVYAYPGGLIADRWGLRKALSSFTLLSLAGYIWLLASPHWAWVILSAFLFLSWSSFSLPATFSLIGSSLAANQHAMGIGVQATLKRIPIIFGPIAGGLLMDQFGIINGTRLGVMVAIALACATTAIQWQIRDDARKHCSIRACFILEVGSFVQPGTAASADVGYPGSLLRADSLRLGHSLRHGQPGADSNAVWHPDGNRNGLCDCLPHSSSLPFRPLWPRAVCHCDLCLLHALSSFFVGGSQFQRTLRCFRYSRVKGIRGDGEEIADHSALPRTQARPDHRDVLFDSRLPGDCRGIPRVRLYGRSAQRQTSSAPQPSALRARCSTRGPAGGTPAAISSQNSSKTAKGARRKKNRRPSSLSTQYSSLSTDLLKLRRAYGGPAWHRQRCLPNELPAIQLHRFHRSTHATIPVRERCWLNPDCRWAHPQGLERARAQPREPALRVASRLRRVDEESARGGW